MGLAERFKDKLENKNIFKKNEIEQSLEDNDIQFISKPITDNIVIQPKNIHTGQIDNIDNIQELNICNSNKQISTSNVLKFEDLETEIIAKIRKTPYWEEFSKTRQEQMISKYFDKKILNSKYENINYTNKEKLEFIRNIIALSNNR